MEENRENNAESVNDTDRISKKPISENAEEFIPDEILESIPVEDRGKIVSIIKQSMFSGVMRRGNPNI